MQFNGCVATDGKRRLGRMSQVNRGGMRYRAAAFSNDGKVMACPVQNDIHLIETATGRTSARFKDAIDARRSLSRMEQGSGRCHGFTLLQGRRFCPRP